jgi:hypothetical protein
LDALVTHRPELLCLALPKDRVSLPPVIGKLVALADSLGDATLNPTQAETVRNLRTGLRAFQDWQNQTGKGIIRVHAWVFAIKICHVELWQIFECWISGPQGCFPGTWEAANGINRYGHPIPPVSSSP